MVLLLKKQSPRKIIVPTVEAKTYTYVLEN